MLNELFRLEEAIKILVSHSMKGSSAIAGGVLQGMHSGDTNRTGNVCNYIATFISPHAIEIQVTYLMFCALLLALH